MHDTTSTAGNPPRFSLLRSAVATGFAALALLAAGATSASAQTEFCEENGMIVIQIESAPAGSGWVAETSLPGWTGTSYYRWAGGNQFANPGLGILTYKLKVTTPGTYLLRIRNYHNHPDPTLENDVWSRMNGGPWLKIYSPSPVTTDWNWGTWFDPAVGSDTIASYNFTAGTHTFQLSGRSQNFRMDRMHFFINGHPTPQNLGMPESFCPDTWVNLGQGKAGTGGQMPLLVGTGTLAGGSNMQLALSQARGNAASTLVIGVSQINAPFKGGVMVPSLTFLITGLVTTPGGLLTLNSTWPNGIPAGTSLYFQHWIADPVATQGLAASNGLEANTP